MTKKHKLLLLFLLLVGTLIQSSTMFRSGLLYNFGIGFWGPNAHDGVWHLALASQIFKGFPPPQPTLSGFVLTNYHFFFDYLLGFAGWLTKIPSSLLYFQIFPILFSFLIGTLSFLVGYRWKKNFWVGFWFAFLNYFAGSLGFIVSFFKNGEFGGGESMFWAMQSISTLINPPFSLSLIFLLLGMILILSYQKLTWVRVFFLSLIFGLLIWIKSYAGVLGLSGLFIFSLYNLKKEKKYIYSFFGALLLSLVFLFCFSRGAGQLFVFKPFWFVNSMIESTDRLGWSFLAVRINNLKGALGLKLVFFELLGLLIFFLGNLGIRIVGVGSIVGAKKDNFKLFLLPIAMVGFLFPLFFVQEGTPWNTIQFFYYTLFIFNLFTAEVLSEIFKKRNKVVIPIVFLVVFLLLPSNIGSLKNYWGWPPPAMISTAQAQALRFLSKQSEGIVLTYPYSDSFKSLPLSTPKPINFYETTAFVTAYSGKQTFLADEMNLQITQGDVGDRKNMVTDFFSNGMDKDKAFDFLASNNIRYVFLNQGEELPENLRDLTELIYLKEGLSIYKVKDTGIFGKI